MNSILYPICAALNAVALIYKLRVLRSDRSPAQWALLANFFFLVLIYTVSTPEVWVATSRFVGIVNFSGLFTQSCVMLLTASQQLLLLHLTYEPRTAWRKAAPRLIGIGAVLVTMVVLFTTATSLHERPTDFALTKAQYYPAYLTVYLVAYTWNQIDVCILCWRYSTLAPTVWLRRGLRLVALTLPFGMVYSACRAADIAAGQFGVSGQAWEWLAPLSVSANAIAKTVGWTLPDWGPHLSRTRELISLYRTHRRLRPLHHEITALVPHVVLHLGDAVDLRTRLYRRVVEIRDAQWALRTWMDPSITAQARQTAEQAGLTDDELAAAVEAANLQGAVHAKTRGIQPAQQVSSPSLAEPQGLVAELAFQRKLARAYATPLALTSLDLLARSAPTAKDRA
ncbi:MAB_1171c family putative transporter [Streptomyces sp. NPDC058301]|uniref:MAB_1171c family putative transporter n=1 Tax=Streptomyces sp. NPDC058301 TaxID=3346436 RepID=UPI0036E21981